MRYLFISYSFPGSLGPMASWLAQNPRNNVLMASSRSQHDRFSGNVQRVILKTWQGKDLPDRPDYYDLWMQAAKAGKNAHASLLAVRDSGFEPDMIFISSTNGSALNIESVFPTSFRVNFLEDENFWKAGQAAMREDVQSLEMLHSHMSFTFSRASLANYPKLLRERVNLAPLMADTAFFHPDNRRKDEDAEEFVSVFCNSPHEKDLEKAWGMSLELLRLRPACHITIFPGNAVIMRKMGEMRLSKNLAPRLRLELPLRQELLRGILAKSLLAVFSFPDMNLDLLQAMACGVAPVLGSPVDSLRPDVDMYLFKEEECAKIANEISIMLDDKSGCRLIGEAARDYVTRNHDAAKLMPHFFQRIEKCYQNWVE